MYRTVVTIYTSNLTFNNSTFCPQSVFMYFLWIWEQTAVSSHFSTNWFIQFAVMFAVKAALSDTLCRQFSALFCNVLLLVDLAIHAAHLSIEAGFGMEAAVAYIRHNSHICLKRLNKPTQPLRRQPMRSEANLYNCDVTKRNWSLKLRSRCKADFVWFVG